MASVAALNARIVELSSAISRQKDILRDLERQKSDVQSDLNSILDPMARLPLEVSSDIFMRCLLDHAIPFPHPIFAPMLLTRVCRSWNKLAISTPSLWASIRITTPSALAWKELTELWFDRASNSPLIISLSGPLHPDVRQSVHQNAHRVQSLDLYLLSGDELEEIATPLHSLKSLIIGQGTGGEDDEEQECYSRDARECVEMLRAAPDLVDCTLVDILHSGSFNDSFPQLTHSGLKHLRLGLFHGRNSALILRSLTLPALESLFFTFMDIKYDHFLGFLTRSIPPLKTLEMAAFQDSDWSNGGLERLFRLLPSLTDLRLTFHSRVPSQNPSFFEVLAIGSPPLFLPNLSNLTMSTAAFGVDRLQFRKLVAALSARRACRQSQMDAFRLVLRSRSVTATLPADILVDLRQLVADGMRIHIGPEGTNYV
ncbi:hypothetical protein FB451DRAFT_1079486 [Mycena latifolia]|nr:hypothetical protein FB451DRAFT_1079486 [Mycena latifolia]